MYSVCSFVINSYILLQNIRIPTKWSLQVSFEKLNIKYLVLKLTINKELKPSLLVYYLVCVATVANMTYKQLKFDYLIKYLKVARQGTEYNLFDVNGFQTFSQHQYLWHEP